MDFSSIQFGILFSGIFLCAYGLMYLVDNRSNWQFVAWCNGEADSPFYTESSSDTSNIDKIQIVELRQRIENLEKIITDSTYELDEKLRRL